MRGWYEPSPLHIAAAGGADGFDGIVSSLLASGVDKDEVDGKGGSPRTKAAGKDHLAVVNILLAAGADVEIRSRRGDTAWDLAAKGGHLGVLRVFLAHGADVNAPDKTSQAALHYAAGLGQADAIDALVEAGAFVDLEDSGGRTPLGCAARHTQCEAMRALFRHGANARAQAKDGDTPLHMACLLRDPAMATAVDILLRHGADETTANNGRELPAYLVRWCFPWEKNSCSPEERERAPLLLARAPADKAWRRRGWLVCSALARLGQG